MRILFLTQWFQPEPLFKGLPFAKALRDRGHEVEVITGFPNYPGGKIYPGYKLRLWQREVIEGIRINRVALYPSHDRSSLKRIMNYLSFGLSSTVIGTWLIKKPDVIYVYNLVTLGVLSLMLRTFWGCPVVYDVQDIWPDSITSSGMIDDTFLLKTFSYWCRTVYRHASHVVTLSPGVKAELIRRGIPENRISVVYNWCDEDHIRPVERDHSLAVKLGLTGEFVVMFAGTMGLMQGLDAVLEAAEKVGKIEPRIKFVLVGGGIDQGRLKIVAAERHLSNVVFWERQPPEAMKKILALADVTLVHLKDRPLLRMAIPSKLQAYMAAGKPVLLAVRGDAVDVVRASGCGKVVDPENAESISQGVLELFSAPQEERNLMGMNARKYYEDALSMRAGIRRFENIFKLVCDKEC